MSFFGFDATLPRDKPPQSDSHGMFESRDPFAGLSGGGEDDGEILDFEDTYDGLGQRLDETGDAFNDDTFGGDGPVTRDTVGKDFDFAGETAKIRDTLLEEQALHHARQPVVPTRARKPATTGYEAYKQPDYLPKLEADASIWGPSVGKKTAADHPADPSTAALPTSMMSLEEVEAAMRARSRPSGPGPDVQTQTQGLKNMLGLGGASDPPSAPPHHEQKPPVQILQRPQSREIQPQPHQPGPDYAVHAPQILQRPHPQQTAHQQSQDLRGQLPHPMAFQQAQGGQGVPPPFQHRQGPVQPLPHHRGPSFSGPSITQAQQILQMRPEDREAYLAEEAKRAKRNHKIFLLSKDNGLMTPQDKNFITRIQLQQLVTATGSADNEPGSEDQLAEDFYYQVYAQIRGPPRSEPGQPLNHFVQTYLLQTSSRYGYGRGRHHPRGGDNHIQRMEQQVARAVEAAKARPKNKQLVVEGSLGRIAFSNSKTPRPLLNIKRPDSATPNKQPQRHVAAGNRKIALKNIEHLYATLMKLEDHERKLPPPPTEDSPPDIIEGHMKWRSEMQELNTQLWEALKVMEAVKSDPSSTHPFIQILSHGKGKKAIPRVFRHLDERQRLTMLSLIAVVLDTVDVIRDAYPPADNSPIPTRVKEEVELFSQAVMPSLFSYVNEAPLSTINGMVGIINAHVNVQAIVRTKIGVSFLTMLISRAELIKQQQSSDNLSSDDWQEWTEAYGRLFDTVEPVLPYIFSTETNISASDDVHVWQFLAAMGVGASPDQQQRLVLGVKDRVMETVAVGKTLPEEMSVKRLADVNLFMRAIGLDVELLG